MLQAELKVRGGKQDGRSIPLPHGKFIVGREEDCHLRPKSELVSRHHCVFAMDDFTLRLRDLGSTNGTFVNGEAVQGQVLLSDGDQVRIGKLAFVVQVREVEDQAPRPEPERGAILEDTTHMSTEDTLVDVPVPAEMAAAQQESFSAPQADAADEAMSRPTPAPANAPEPVAAPPQPAPAPPEPVAASQPATAPPTPTGAAPTGAAPASVASAPAPAPAPGAQTAPAPPPPPPMPIPIQSIEPMPPVPEGAPAVGGAAVPIPSVRLPDPSTTGIKNEESASKGGESSNGEDPSNRAGDIIRQYMKRRAGV